MDRKKSGLIKALKIFKEKNGIEKMYLFGSMATGKQHKWSDVDLIVVSKKFRGKGILGRSPELYMKWDLDYPVDFLCYTPEEFQKMKAKVSIVKEALDHGVSI